MVPAGLAHLATVVFTHAAQRRAQALVLLAAVGPYLLIFSAWRIDPGGPAKVTMSELSSAGLQRQGGDGHAAAYAYLAEQIPIGTLVAGWPTDLDDVPYLTGRRALATRETHQAFHRRYAELMRKRVRATIDALYDKDSAALVRLRDEFGVTHVVVSRRLYAAKPPAYFAPFAAHAADARARLGSAEPAALREADRAAVVAEEGADGWVVLDLDRLR
jgi:hypothetical protein